MFFTTTINQSITLSIINQNNTNTKSILVCLLFENSKVIRKMQKKLEISEWKFFSKSCVLSEITNAIILKDHSISALPSFESEHWFERLMMQKKKGCWDE